MPEKNYLSHLCDTGSWRQRIGVGDFAGKPAVFLDRDGVIVEEVNYLHRVGDIRMMPGMAEAIASVNRLGLPVVMITNQAGIGRGYFDWSHFALVQEAILRELAAHEATVDLVLASAYHKDGIGEYRHDNHSWRKPRPGMLHEAHKVLGLDLKRSFIIGDTATDMQAGFHAGLPGGTLVLTGHGRRDRVQCAEALSDLERRGFRLEFASDAAEALCEWLAKTGDVSIVGS